MKNINKLLSMTAALVLLISACHKVEDLPYYGTGTKVTLTANKTTLAPTPADSITNVIAFNWTNPDYKQDSSLYKYILEIDSAARNFAKETTKIVVGTRSLSITGKELNGILLKYGFTIGTAYDLDFRITSSYGNNNERYLSNVVKVRITPYNDPSVLATSATSVICSPATQTSLATTFSWSRSFNGYSSAVTYVIQYDSATKNFANPKSIAIGNDIYLKALIQRELNDNGLNCGITGGTTGKVEYRIKATTAEGAVSYSNVVSITIKTYPVKLYLVGGSSPASWSPAAATPFIADPRFPGVFYTYATLNAGGGGIKFLSENTDWNTPTQVIFGDVNGSGNTGNLTTTGGGSNIVVPTDGVYRITVDLANMKYYLQTGGVGAVGLVGAFQGWGPPGPKMACFTPNRLILLQDMSNNDEFKFHDGNNWTNSALNDSRWYDVTSGGNIFINGTPGFSGSNFKWTGATGRVRAIFDYGNVSNPTYVLAAASEMRVVGSGIQGVPDWNPGASPQMAYQGNGVWTLTTTLVTGKEIKFLSGNDWSGNLDYEDNGAAAAPNTRKIKWEGGSNFSTPAVTGSYTITLDEYAQTVKIQ